MEATHHLSGHCEWEEMLRNVVEQNCWPGMYADVKG